ncbi:DUF3667 domain-containing protein [Aureisphaera galaxeae]|uniref:DUF3667 domain-containing protein n=1 Tax=Aureisphaera galaxeae TaxID=1538023 RepID=UPI00234FC413|nr:DUF3667 domain-containing protein [Aureisphaera galaxeae]MDC8003262.1 DUF3667 domain-containing protein [Aureisphaera galaxeae]
MTNQLPTKHKGRKAAKYRAPKCLNCGTPLELSDMYCSYCGQLNTTKSLSLKDFFGEFIGSIITYDSRFRFTLKDLLLRPGVITRNYVGGQRLKYANPFRFFLSVSIIYFLVQSLIATFTGTNNLINDGNKKGPNFELKSDGENFKLVPKVPDSISIDSVLKAQGVPVEAIGLDSILAANEVPSTQELDSMIKEAIPKPKEADSLKTYEYISEEHLDTLNRANKIVKRFSLYYDFYEATGIKDPAQALDSLKHANTGYNRWAYNKNEAFEQIKERPAEFATYLFEKTPFFVFFFTPFYALFFWLIYSRKKYTYMEHMIFIFHIFSFVFLAMLIAILPDMLIGEDVFVSILFLLIGPFYFYKALRNFYQQKRLITIIKFIFLNFVFLISATISAVLFFAVTAAMY